MNGWEARRLRLNCITTGGGGRREGCEETGLIQLISRPFASGMNNERRGVNSICVSCGKEQEVDVKDKEITNVNHVIVRVT